MFPLAGCGPNRKIDTGLLCRSIHITIKVNRYSQDVKCQELSIRILNNKYVERSAYANVFKFNRENERFEIAN